MIETNDLVGRLRDSRRRTPFEPWARKTMSEAADRIAELEGVLEPFAKAADWKESGYSFEIPDTVYCEVTLHDLRRARAALKEGQ